MKIEKSVPNTPQNAGSALSQADHPVISERRLWHSLDTIRDGFAIFDSRDRLVVANKAYLSIFGGDPSVKPGISYTEIVRLIANAGIMDREGRTAEDWVEQALYRRELDPIPDLVIRLFNGQYVKLIDRRTASGDIACLNINITENMRMWAGVEAIPDGFVLYDRDDRLVFCNDRYREIYTESAEVMQVGNTFEQILRAGLDKGQYKTAIGREEEWLANRIAEHDRADATIEQQLSDGRWLRILEKRTPDGGLVGLRVDITEQKKQQEALDKARVAAEAANRAKSAFLANMSHELRTPMNGVVGMAELLCETELTDEQRLYAETIRSSGEALLSLVNDVLDFSKIEAEKLKLHNETFDLERTIHEIVTLLHATAQDKTLDLFIDYDMFLPTRLIGDRGRIRQVLTNLIGNAVKFTEKGHVLVRVVGFEAGETGKQQIHITVEDTGIGIAPEMQGHIFGEFNQVDDLQNRKFEGTGLGLAICKQLIELMGGEVWIESEVGKGSCFGIRLQLPLAVDEVELDMRLPMKPRRALVVDDHRVNRTILDRQLSQLGFEVVKHSTGQKVLQNMLRDGPFDLIVTDYRMPEMDGFQLAKQMRERGVESPILMLSSSPTALRRAAQEPAVDLVLTKPTLRRTLFDAVGNLINGTLPKGAASLTEPERPMRILAAEDNKTNTLVLQKMLQGAELELQFATNGFEAIDAFQERRPDLILMDISMPQMDGKEATRSIRAIEERNHLNAVPIVALTAHAVDGEDFEVLSAGMNNYLTKPLRKDKLLEVIRDYHPEQCLPLERDETD